MRYKVTASVEGILYLEKDFSFNNNDLIVEFLIDKENKLSEISISIDVKGKDVEKYRSVISKIDGIVHISVSGDAAVENRIMNSFRLLESNLSFISRGALRKIHWESAKEECIPQSEEEKECVKVSSFRTTKEYPEPKILIKETVLEHYVKEGEKYEELATEKAFWREGMTYYRNFQYIQAFYNYYFVIEGFYANGKTSEKEVIKEFSKSKELSEIADKATKTFLNEKRHGKKRIVPQIRTVCKDCL